MRTSTILVGLVLVAGAAVIGGRYVQTGSAKDTPSPAMPAGITLQGFRPKPLSAPPPGKYLADAAGMTLYSFDKDTDPGKSNCTDACAKAWPAFAAPADAKGAGDWSVVRRADGTAQWAYKGKPLYRFASDAAPGDTKGNGVDGAWHVALHEPAAGMALPDGIAVAEMNNAGGAVLTNKQGKPLYQFDGDAAKDKPACPAGSACTSPFLPLSAPELANPIGDFTLARRADGSRQWAYRGRPLYTYLQDTAAGDAKGKDVDPHYRTALVERYFMPDGIKFRVDERGEDILSTADGRTIYLRDRYIYGVGGHYVRGEHKQNPLIGRAFGTASCDAECTKVWQPLVAPANARASGYWSVFDRGDGTRQWAYQGYALYTYTGDKVANATTGDDIYDINVRLPSSGISVFDGTPALYWRVVYP